MGWHASSVTLLLTAAALVLALVGVVYGLWAGRRLRREQRESTAWRTLAAQRAQRPAVLSHEIRTPLSLVAGAAELLAEETPGPLTQRQREFVGTILENTRQVIEMAEDFLSEARLDAELFDLHLTRFDLRELVRETVGEARAIHSAALGLDAAPTPVWVMADRQLLRQALWNLVNNAARHAGEGATVRVRVARTDTGAFFAVSDNGSGLSEAERHELFTPFRTGSSRRPGSGLGLSITQRIVQLHGGQIMVDTIARHGTTIYFTLPRQAEFSPPTTSPTSPHTPTPTSAPTLPPTADPEEAC